MKIDVNDVIYIAKLAKLRFTDEEIQTLAKEFEGILSHFESIDNFDLSEVDIDVYSENMKPVLKKDEVTIFEDKNKLFRNAKSMEDTAIKVPKIIE